MITTFFLGFVALMTAAIVALSARYRNGRFAFGVLAALCAWFIYVGVLGYLGVIANTAMFPPGIALIFVPVVAFLVLFILRVGSSAGARMALVFPLWALIGTQAFRVGVELFIHQLWIDGLAPKMLTFAGANVDIYIGASAPVIAWLSMRGGWGQRLALLWNLLGLLSLANVVTRAVLTAPGPLNLIHAEVPNRMIGRSLSCLSRGFSSPWRWCCTFWLSGRSPATRERLSTLRKCRQLAISVESAKPDTRPSDVLDGSGTGDSALLRKQWVP
jgi:hypothetical protein